MTTIPIVELFGPTIQGEGALCGQVSYFIRTGSCSYRCSWCDSMHAVDPRLAKQWERLDSTQILERLQKLAPVERKQCWVTLTGGDPVLWDLSHLVVGLRLLGFKVAVETQGAVWRDWLEACDLVTVSPKPPSSGMADRVKLPILQKYAVRLDARLVLKIVCFGAEDLEWASRIRMKVPRTRLYLSSGTPVDPTASKDAIRNAVLRGFFELVAAVLERPELHDAAVLPQLHALLWGSELGR